MRQYMYCIVFTLILSACTTTAPIEYYRLPSATFQWPQQQTAPVRVQVKLADELDQGNLILQTSPTHIAFAQKHLWAGELHTYIANSLANHLNQQIQSHAFIVDKNQHPSWPTLTVYIENFQGRYDGYTQISGYTSWQGLNYTKKNFNVLTPQYGDGYAAMVDSLAQGLNIVVKQIAP